jgi:hypothetical protein
MRLGIGMGLALVEILLEIKTGPGLRTHPVQNCKKISFDMRNEPSTLKSAERGKIEQCQFVSAILN